MANEALRLIGSATEAPTDAASDELNLREVWRALMRRKLALLTPVVLITLACSSGPSSRRRCIPERPSCTCRPATPRSIQVEGVVEEMIADPATIESEIEFLSSPAFSRRIVEKLDLTNDPEFAPWLRKAEPDPIGAVLELLNPMRYIPEDWLLSDNAQQETALDPEAKRLNQVANAVGGRLTVEQVGRSYVISLQFLSEDPAKAASIANTMAEEYLASQVEAKYAAAERHEVVEREDRRAAREVLAAEAKIVEYRSTNNLVNTTTDNPLTLQFFQLNTQLALAQAERAEAEARLTQARSMLESSGAATAALVLGSSLMDNLRAQETELIREISEMRSTYGEKHPVMVNLRSEIGSIRGKMQDEVRRIVQDFENEVSVATAREQELTNSMNRLQDDAARADLAGVELARSKARSTPTESCSRPF